MKTIIKILAVVSLIILLTGCSSSGNWVFFGDDSEFEYEDYRQGVKEIEMNFLQESPPNEVFEGSDFQVGIRLRNEGGSDTKQAILKVTPLAQELVDIEKIDENPFSMQGRSNVNPKGDEIVYTLPAKAKPLSNLMSGLESHEVSIIAKLCYLYESYASPTVCIDTAGDENTKVCEVKDVTLSGQGAPVAVTNVEVSMIPTESGINPNFKIHVKNKGDGHVYHPNYFDSACTKGSSSDEEIDTVFISASLDDRTLDCTPKHLQLGNENHFTCTTQTPLTSKGAYTTPLEIKLTYGYMNSIKESVEIKKRT